MNVCGGEVSLTGQDDSLKGAEALTGEGSIAAVVDGVQRGLERDKSC